MNGWESTCSGVKRDDIGALLAYLSSRGFALLADGKPLRGGTTMLSNTSSAEVDTTLKRLFPPDANVTWADLLQVGVSA